LKQRRLQRERATKLEAMQTPSTARAAKPLKGAGKPAPVLQVIEELRPGQSIELLKELHILTREGKLNQDTRRKLKQVYHLYQFIEPLLNEVAADEGRLHLADHGAGKSYLGFILYDLFFNVAHRRAAMSTASKRAPNWSSNHACWPSVWVLGACQFLNLSVPRPPLRPNCRPSGYRHRTACLRHRDR
jgi:hypothetical protein